MDTIAVGVDGSTGSATALAWAAELARAHGAVVELVTAVDPTPDPARQDEPTDDEPTDDDLPAAAEREARSIQREATATLLVDDVEFRGVVEAGRPADVLAARSADLLVVGTRGHGQVAATLIGSVAREVVRSTRRPVAVVHTDGGSMPPSQLVVGVDGSPVADRALAWAVREARIHGAAVEVVSTYHVGPTLIVPPLAPPVPRPDPREQHERTARLVREALDRVEHAGVTVTWTVGEGRPDRRLVDRAHDADLLVVGSRGLGATESMVLGSTSQRALASSPVPVVVVH